MNWRAFTQNRKVVFLLFFSSFWCVVLREMPDLTAGTMEAGTDVNGASS